MSATHSPRSPRYAARPEQHVESDHHSEEEEQFEENWEEQHDDYYPETEDPLANTDDMYQSAEYSHEEAFDEFGGTFRDPIRRDYENNVIHDSHGEIPGGKAKYGYVNASTANSKSESDAEKQMRLTDEYMQYTFDELRKSPKCAKI